MNRDKLKNDLEYVRFCVTQVALMLLAGLGIIAIAFVFWTMLDMLAEIRHIDIVRRP